jgi:hypothetical protein
MITTRSPTTPTPAVMQRRAEWNSFHHLPHFEPRGGRGATKDDTLPRFLHVPISADTMASKIANSQLRGLSSGGGSNNDNDDSNANTGGVGGGSGGGGGWLYDGRGGGSGGFEGEALLDSGLGPSGEGNGLGRLSGGGSFGTTFTDDDYRYRPSGSPLGHGGGGVSKNDVVSSPTVPPTDKAPDRPTD